MRGKVVQPNTADVSWLDTFPLNYTIWSVYHERTTLLNPLLVSTFNNQGYGPPNAARFHSRLVTHTVLFQHHLHHLHCQITHARCQSKLAPCEQLFVGHINSVVPVGRLPRVKPKFKEGFGTVEQRPLVLTWHDAALKGDYFGVYLSKGKVRTSLEIGL